MNKLFLPQYDDCFLIMLVCVLIGVALASMCCKLSSSVELTDDICCYVVCMYL